MDSGKAEVAQDFSGSYTDFSFVIAEEADI